MKSNKGYWCKMYVKSLELFQDIITEQGLRPAIGMKEFGVWSALLVRAKTNMPEGIISGAHGAPLLFEQLALDFGMGNDDLMATLIKFSLPEYSLITIEKSSTGGRCGVIRIINWKEYQPDSVRTGQYRSKTRTDDDADRSETELAKKDGKAEEYRSDANPKDVEKQVFDYWNSLGIMKHKVMESHVKAIRKAIKNRSVIADITTAMTNYKAVLDNPNQFFSHYYTLTDFLNRGIEKFYEECHPHKNWIGKKVTAKKPASVGGWEKKK